MSVKLFCLQGRGWAGSQVRLSVVTMGGTSQVTGDWRHSSQHNKCSCSGSLLSSTSGHKHPHPPAGSNITNHLLLCFGRTYLIPGHTACPHPPPQDMVVVAIS